MLYICTSLAMEEIFKHTISFDRESFKELITKMIYIAQALSPNSMSEWLTKKELELLVELVGQYYVHDGEILDEAASIKEALLNTSFSKKDKNIYIYRGKLVDKGWIQHTANGYELVPFLKTLKPQFDQVDIQVSINSL